MLQGEGPLQARHDLAGSDESRDFLEVRGALLGGKHGQSLGHKGRDGQCAQLPAHARDVAAVLAAGNDGGPPGCERPPEPGQGRVSGQVKDEVVLRAACCEVVTGIVDDVVSTQRTDQIQLVRAADAGDLGAERLG